MICVFVNSSGPGEQSIEIDPESQPLVRGQMRLVCNISAIFTDQLNSIQSSSYYYCKFVMQRCIAYYWLSP